MGPAPIRIIPPTEIDADTVQVLMSELTSIDAGCHVLIDCSEVTFMDSSGIRAIITESERQSTSGGWLRVDNPSAVVRRLLELTDLTRFISDAAF